MSNLWKTLMVVVVFLSVVAVYERFESTSAEIQVLKQIWKDCYTETTERLDTQAKTLGYITDCVRKHKTGLEELYKEFDLSVLDACGIITNGYGSGSCVAIGEDLILTAGHCLQYGELWVEINGRKFEIVEQWKSEKYDIGFVRVNKKVSYLQLGLMPNLLDTIYVVGSPLQSIHIRKCVNNITKGIVSNLDVDWYIWSHGIIVDAAAYPGNSGGPLLDVDGNILGIMVGCHNRIPSGGDNFWLAESVHHIRSALRTYLSR